MLRLLAVNPSNKVWMMSNEGLRLAQEKMRAAGVADVAINVFTEHYRMLESGQHGKIHEADIEPVVDLPHLDHLADDEATMRSGLASTAVIKLNGGLGTSMGVSGAKSSLTVRGDLTFLDVIAQQILALRQRFDATLPLLLMNSFRSRDESLQILERYPLLPIDGLPLDFLQNVQPKIRADDLTPVTWPADPELEWCPPGHGDLFVALEASGVLEALRAAGYRQAFISNADNLGAVPDGRIAAWLADHDVPFGMEVCRRTRSDRKGGHLAVRTADGQLVLRDSAQVADGDEASFQDITRHTTFNTNNLWINLDRLAEQQAAHQGGLGLPLIVNKKTVDPTDPGSPQIIQLETGMGTAIEVFDGAQAVIVDRARFRPVKTTDDLLLLRSDAYRLTRDATLEAAFEGDEPYVELDADHFKVLAGFEAHFPHGVPSLAAAERFKVVGDVTFGRDVVVTGDVVVTASTGEQLNVPAGTHLTG